MIFTPLVKNKLASLLALPQSGCTSGNHQGGGGRGKALGKFTSLRGVIDGGERRGREGGGALWTVAEAVISKRVK